MAAAGGRLIGFSSRILGRGMTAARLSGRVTGVPLAPGIPFCSAEWVSAGQIGCGIAWMRCHAVMISSVQGQVAAILRVRRRPPRTRRAAACRRR